MVADTNVLVMAVVTSLIAGVVSGVTGFGSSILIQTCFRVAVSLFHIDLGTPEELSALILSLTTITGVAQNTFGGIASLRAKKYRTDIVAYLSPTTNVMVFVGNYAAVTLRQAVLTRFLGVVLILASVWQFTNLNILTVLKRLKEGTLTMTSDEREKYEAEQKSKSEPTTPIDKLASDKDPSTPPSSSTETTFTITQSDSPTSPNEAEPPETSLPKLASASSDHFQDDDMTITEKDRVVEDRSIPFSDRCQQLWTQCKIHLLTHKREALMGLFVGVLSGFLGGAFGIAGPPVMIYFSMLGLSGDAIRDTYMLVCFASNPFLIASRLYFSVFRAEDWLIYLVGTVVVVIGLRTGYYLHNKVDTETILLILQLLIVCASIPLMEPHVYAGGFGVFACIFYAIVFAYFAAIMVWKYRLLKAARAKAAIDQQTQNELASVELTAISEGTK